LGGRCFVDRQPPFKELYRRAGDKEVRNFCLKKKEFLLIPLPPDLL